MEEETVRVIRGSSDPEYYTEQVKASPQEEAEAQILDNALQTAQEASEAITQSVNWLAIIKPQTKNSTLPTLIRQHVEEIKEIQWQRQNRR